MENTASLKDIRNCLVVGLICITKMFLAGRCLQSELTEKTGMVSDLSFDSLDICEISKAVNDACDVDFLVYYDKEDHGPLTIQVIADIIMKHLPEPTVDVEDLKIRFRHRSYDDVILGG